MANRARVIYQSEALYAGTVDATGHHYSVSNDNWSTKTGYSTRAEAVAAGGDIRTGIMQLRRVQSANYSFSVNREDVNQFGQLARIDSVSLEPPTVTLDFSYYLTNGINEKILGMNVDGQTSAIAGDILLGRTEDAENPGGKNFFIITTQEGTDAVGNEDDESLKNVIALGNGFVTNYSVEASVGGMPTASVTIDGFNLRSYTGTQDLELPAINNQFGIPMTGGEFSIPPAISGVHDVDSEIDFGKEGVSCLRPGDIHMALGNGGRASLFEPLPFSDPEKDYDAGTAHIQSFSIDVPVGRSTIERLGNPYGYSKVVDFPLNINVSVSAILSDLKEGNVTDILFDQEQHDLQFTLREPDQFGTGDIAMLFTIRNARLEGESFSSSIGDNKTVDLTFTAQIGGPQDTGNGLFISGSRNATGIHQYFA
ncbi:MAG: hypothetical protein EBY39_09390 [Flavobacteriia bacterium]|nr:hypothetical protein [Flavobacteriia bacterium]